MRSAIIIPTYNERENLADLVREIFRLNLPDFGVIVVDDASPDGTGTVADELARENGAIRVVHRRGKLGLGTAYRRGIDEARKSGAQILGTMDADFSHHPRYLPQMFQAMETADVVIGSRYVRGGSTTGWSIRRKMLSAGANFVARTLLRLKVHDATAGFRLYRRSLLDQLDLDAVHSEGYSYLVELLFRCQQHGARFTEVPIVFENRTRGTSKISRKEVRRAMGTIFRLARERKKKADS